MSKNEVALFEGKINLPSYIKDLPTDDITKSLAGGGQGKRISIKGGVFRMMVAGDEVASIDDRTLNVVIVAAAPKVARTWYAEKFVEGDANAPDCWSADGVKPDKSSAQLQSNECATCPQNISGSGEGDSRACRYSQRLAVVLENDMTSNVYQLSLPAMSIFGKPENGKMPLQSYAKFLSGHGVPITAVVTELKFDTSAAVPKLFFSAKRALEEAEYLDCQAQGKTPDAVNAITMTVAAMDGVTKTKTQKVEAKAEAAPKPAKKAAPAAPVEDEVPEPVVKKDTRPEPVEATVAGGRSKLKNIIAEWAKEDD